MKVELLYFEGCPNWHDAEDNLRAALRAVGALEEGIDRQPVVTQEMAERVGFLGSPSVLIDGTDPFAKSGARPGLTCRVYRTSTGSAGAPSVDQLTEALARAMGRPEPDVERADRRLARPLPRTGSPGRS